MENMKHGVFSKEFNGTFNAEQIRDLPKEMEVGNWLYMAGLRLDSINSLDTIHQELEVIEMYLTRVKQADCRLLNPALQPTMVTLVQLEFMEHPQKEMRLVVALCFSAIM